MKKEHSITQLIVDESGSMQGFNPLVKGTYQSIVRAMRNERVEFPELQQYFQAWTFSSGEISVRNTIPIFGIHEDTHFPELEYNPKGGTPLYDAMGRALISLETHIQNTPTLQNEPEISVVIVTDGYENDSQEFTGSQIGKLVSRLQSKGWKFTYHGTDHDVHEMAAKMAIKNAYSFSKNARGFENMSASVVRHRHSDKEAFLKEKLGNKEF